jgi:hypothetical protein
LEKFNSTKKIELIDLQNLAKEQDKEYMIFSQLVEKSSKRIEELTKEMEELQEKLQLWRSILLDVTPRQLLSNLSNIEIKEKIQQNEMLVEFGKNSEQELRNHLETLTKKLDCSDDLIQKRDLSAFKVEDVAVILDKIALSKFEHKFKQQEIDGVALLTMKDKHLIDLGMDDFHDRKRVLLAVDLIQNYGILHPSPSINEIYTWNSERVCEWLKEIGFEGNIDEFKKMNINGMVLLYLSDEDLERLKVTKMGDRMRLLNALEMLKRKAFKE